MEADSSDKGKEKVTSRRKKAKVVIPQTLEIKFDPQTFGEQLQAGVKDLHNNETLSDIDLLVGSERIKAHKFLLFAWSKKFQELLSAEEQKELKVEVKPDDVDNFKMMLEYMYTGASQKKINKDNAMPLLEMCFEYGISPLKEECGDFIFESSREELNVVALLEIAQRYQTKKLERKCADHLAENFDDLINNEIPGGEDMLIRLEPSTWEELLKSDEANVSREEELFNAVLKYADTRGTTADESKAILTRLLPHIRFSLCSPKFLVEEVEANEDLMSIPVLRDLLFETFRYRVNPKASFLRIPINTKRRKANLNVLLQWDKDQPFTHAVYALENDNLTAHKNAQPGTIYVLRTKGKLEPPGSYYWEITVDQTAGTQELHIGVAEDTFNFNTAYLRGQGTYFLERHGAVMQGVSSVGTAPRLDNGDTVAFQLDYDEGTLQVFHNGTPVHTFSNMKGNLWPCVAARDVGTKLTLVGKRPKLYEFGKAKKSL